MIHQKNHRTLLRRLISLLLLLATSLPLVAIEKSVSVMELNLNDCYQRALIQSESLAIGAESIRQAETRYRQALSAMLPEVNLVATERLQNRSGSSFSGNNSNGFSNGGNNNRIDRFGAQVQIHQNIFNGFSDYQVLGAIRAEQRANRSDLIRDRQTLFLDVSNLYYQILSQRRDLELLKELNTALSDRTTELDKRVRIGRSRKSEWLAARTELLDNMAAAAAVSGLIDASRELMAFLLGRPADTFKLVDTQSSHEPAALAIYLQKFVRRPDLAAGEQRVISSEKQVSARRGAFLPTIDFQFNWLALEEPERDDEWNMFFTATLPIFDGGLRTAELAESKSLARSSRLSLERMQRLAEYDVRLAYSNFKSNTAQLLRLREAADIAGQNLSAQEKDYELGRTSNLDVLNALIRHQEVLRRFAMAGYLIRSNFNALHIAAGEIPKN